MSVCDELLNLTELLCLRVIVREFPPHTWQERVARLTNWRNAFKTEYLLRKDAVGL